jgi:AsmA-like C-terminal region/AsmA family
MGMSKKKKIWIAVIATPVILVMIAILALKIYLTSDRLSALVIPPIEKAIQRTVEVKDISLSIFPALAISVDSLAISGPKGGAFKSNDFASVENLKLKINIFKLLQSKLDISYIIVNRPSVYLEVNKEGKSNYALEMGEPQKLPDTAKAEAGTKSMGAFLLSNLEIVDGKIEYFNRQGGSRMIISGFNTKVSIESKGVDGKITIQDTTRIEKFSYGSLLMWYFKEQPISLGLDAVFEPVRDAISIQRMFCMLKEIPLTITGSVEGFSGETMKINLNIGSARAEMSQLLSLIPQDFLKAAKGLQSSGNISFSTIIKGEMNDSMMPGVKGSFAIADGKVQYASLPKAVTGINLEGSFERPATGEPGKGMFKINAFRASAGNANISGKLTTSDFEDPVIFLSLAGQMDLGEIKDFYPLEEGTELRGIITCDFSCQGKIKTPQAIKAQGNAEFKNVFIKNKTSPNPLRDLLGSVQFDNARIESKHLVMKIGESDLSVAFAVRNYLAFAFEEAKKSGGVPSATATLTSRVLRTEDLIGKESTEKAPEQVPVQSKVPGKKAQPAESAMLPPINIDASVKIDSFVTEKFVFTNAIGNIGIADGIVNLKNFSFNAFQGKVSTSGTLDLRDPKKKPFNFDLDVTAVESNDILSKFSSIGKNLFGKFTMKSALKGDLDDTLGINRKTLTGAGTVRVADGKLLGFPLTTKLADYTGISELREVNFQQWTNAFSIADGKVEIKDLAIAAGATNFLVKGSHGLDGIMDYDLTVKLPASVSDRLKLPGVGTELIKLLKDKENRINLNFAVTGETTSPKLSLNTKAQEDVAKKALEEQKNKLIDQGKKKLEDELKKKAQDGLKKLFKKPG